MKRLIAEVMLVLCTFQFFSQGYPAKSSFRGAGHQPKQKFKHFLNSPNPPRTHHHLPRKQAIKNARGKAKDSLDYELDHVLADHEIPDHDEGERSRNDYANYFQPDTGLDRMRTSPVDHDREMHFSEPHLRYDFTYDNSDSSKRHGMNRRVDSYAGEMIDEENTLSHYIAPPVYENNQNRHKTHQSQVEKMLYGTKEAASAENSNTNSFLKSLGSLLSPLALSDKLKKSLQAPRYGGAEDYEKDVEYHGGYNVRKKYPKAERGDGEGDKRTNKHNYDYSENDGHQRDPERHDESRYSDNYEEDKRGDKDYKESDRENDNFSRSNEDYKNPRNIDAENYDKDQESKYDDFRRYDDSLPNEGNIPETRSSEYNHDQPENEKYSSGTSNDPRGAGNEDEMPFARHEDNSVDDKRSDEEQSRSQDKPIEMMQDGAGKLHSLTKGIQSDAIDRDIQKYLPHDSEDKELQ